MNEQIYPIFARQMCALSDIYFKILFALDEGIASTAIVVIVSGVDVVVGGNVLKSANN